MWKTLTLACWTQEACRLQRTHAARKGEKKTKPSRLVLPRPPRPRRPLPSLTGGEFKLTSSPPGYASLSLPKPPQASISRLQIPDFLAFLGDLGLVRSWPAKKYKFLRGISLFARGRSSVVEPSPSWWRTPRRRQRRKLSAAAAAALARSASRRLLRSLTSSTTRRLGSRVSFLPVVYFLCACKFGSARTLSVSWFWLIYCSRWIEP